MMRTLLVLVLAASPAYADDDPLYVCHETTGDINVTFKPESELRDVVTWMLGFTCIDVVLDSSVATTKLKVASGRYTAAQAKAKGLAAIRATGLSVQEIGETLVIKPAGKRACPGAGPSAGPIAPPAPVAKPNDGPTAAEMLAGIRQVSATKAEVKEAAVDAILANPMAVAKGARIVPAMKDGKPQGFKLDAIVAGSFYAKLNFQNGDTLRSINGMELSSMDNGLEVYSKLRTAKHFDIVVDRGGKPVTLVVEIIK